MQNVRQISSEIDNLARSVLDFRRWQFHRSTITNVGDFPYIIYDSQWCKVKVEFSGWEPANQLSEYEISIFYARLHAPNNKALMTWNDKECYCWHGLWGVGDVLNFLDGMSPQDAAVQKGWPMILEKFRQVRLKEGYSKNSHHQPGQLLQTHSFIWKHYGVRLFELFDLRQPDIWDKYRAFLKEYYDIKGRSPNIKPSLDQIC